MSKQKETKPPKTISHKDIWDELSKLTYRYDRSRVFQDWLDLILLSHLSLSDNLRRGKEIKSLQDLATLDGEYDDEYKVILEKYDSEKSSAAKTFTDCFYKLMVLANEYPYEDQLGKIYEQEISRGDHGQFFTPQHIVDTMVEVACGQLLDDQKVLDPCCGSGRMLLRGSKKNPKAYFFGVDIDIRCAKMCAVNFILHKVNGVVNWGDSLTGKMHKEWIIRDSFIFENKNPIDRIPDTMKQTEQRLQENIMIQPSLI